MVAVAVLGLVMGAEKNRRRCLFYRKCATGWRFYEEQANNLSLQEAKEAGWDKEILDQAVVDCGSQSSVAADFRRGIELHRRWSAHYEFQAHCYHRKRILYENAIWRPWETVERYPFPAEFWDEPDDNAASKAAAPGTPDL
jgi:hypothetical protein